MDDLRVVIDDEVAEALRLRAEQHGRTVEEEASALLTGALRQHVNEPSPVNAAELFRRLRDEVGGGVDFELPSRSDWEDRPLHLQG